MCCGQSNDYLGRPTYHEQVNNNAYTNRMVQWHLEKAVAVYAWLENKFADRAAELGNKLQLTPEKLLNIQQIIAKIYILYDPKTELIEQFEGFFQLKDIQLSDYEPRNRSIQVVLGMNETNQRQVLKQPDALMLLYLMRGTQAFPYTHDVLQKNWNYYAPRTDITYGSSLGPAIHAILAADLGLAEDAYTQFMHAALVDLENIRGNTRDGIHAASAGGVWQAVVFGFAGIQLRDSAPVASPKLPPTWTRLKFKLHWHGTWHSFDLSPTPAQAPEIKGFIFDLDGVLTNTAEFHYRAWQRLADEEGLPFNRQDNEALRGVARRESLLHIVGNRHYPESALQEMMDRKNRYYLEFIQAITPKDILPGAVALIDELRQSHIKIAIGSASKNAHIVIEKLGIADRIDVVTDGDSVEHPKPAPDLFLYAAHRLGLDPINCVVVEDAHAGIKAALAAGMWAIGLGPVARVGSAHVVLPNLIGIHWLDLKRQLGRYLRTPSENGK